MTTQKRALLTAVAVASAAVGLALSEPGSAQAAHHQTHKKPWHVTMKADRTEVTVGHKVRLTGKVGKAAAGGLVKLYERGSSGRPWKYQRNALVHRDGHYTTYDKPTVNSVRWYRVVMPGNKHHKKGASEAVRVDVYRWTSLTGFTAVNENYLAVEPSVVMNGVNYPSSLEAEIFHIPTDSPNPQSIEFNVNRKCTMFRGTFGLSDDSESGSQAEVSASADQTTWFDHVYALGESDHDVVTFETPPLKLRFETTSLVDGKDGLGAVGTPEVYCER
jgi:hypothetical protein